MLFQEYDFEVVVKPRRLNNGLDHLPSIESGEEPMSLEEGLPDAQLFAVTMVDDFFVYIVEFLSLGVAPAHYTVAQEKQLVVKSLHYQLITGQLYKLGLDDILRRCILNHDKSTVLDEAHGGISGGNYPGKATTQKILRAGLWWPALHKDAKEYCQACDVYQRIEKPSRRDEMPMAPQVTLRPLKNGL